MRINSLSLQNFRNYADEQVTFRPGINILLGDNGQGKTNVLESIYYLLTGKSYRVQREQELLRWEQNSFYLQGIFHLAGRSVYLESHYQNKKKIIKINHVPCRRLSDFVGTVNVVFFSPDDLIIIKGGPSERRKFIDLQIAQMSPGYIKLLNDYNKVIKQKSALLYSQIDESLKRVQLQLWNEQIVKYGESIIRNRESLIQRLQDTADDIYKNLTSQKEQINLLYVTMGNGDVDEAIANFPGLLDKKMEQEIRRQMVLVGPHRDDLQILLNGKSARLYASQGQQRSLVLSLKLAELELIRQVKKEYPLLLLDDVLSELDYFRRDYLMKFMESAPMQSLITMTSAEKHLSAGTLYFVEQGHIRRGN